MRARVEKVDVLVWNKSNEVGGEEASEGKDPPFSVSTVLGKGNDNSAEEESKFEAESDIEEMTLAENAKDVLVSEGVNKRPTLVWDLVTYGKSSIETGGKCKYFY